jgi:hypothetical protein
VLMGLPVAPGTFVVLKKTPEDESLAGDAKAKQKIGLRPKSSTKVATKVATKVTLKPGFIFVLTMQVFEVAMVST